MTIFEVTCKNSNSDAVSTLFVSRELAEASIRLSYHKIPELERIQRIKDEIEIVEIHVHDRVTHL